MSTLYTEQDVRREVIFLENSLEKKRREESKNLSEIKKHIAIISAFSYINMKYICYIHQLERATEEYLSSSFVVPRIEVYRVAFPDGEKFRLFYPGMTYEPIRLSNIEFSSQLRHNEENIEDEALCFARNFARQSFTVSESDLCIQDYRHESIFQSAKKAEEALKEKIIKKWHALPDRHVMCEQSCNIIQIVISGTLSRIVDDELIKYRADFGHFTTIIEGLDEASSSVNGEARHKLFQSMSKEGGFIHSLADLISKCCKNMNRNEHWKENTCLNISTYCTKIPFYPSNAINIITVKSYKEPRNIRGISKHTLKITENMPREQMRDSLPPVPDDIFEYDYVVNQKTRGQIEKERFLERIFLGKLSDEDFSTCGIEKI